MAIIPFATQSYRSPALPVSSQRCRNMYAEQQPQNAKTQVALFGAPGLVSFASVGSGPIRGMWNMNEMVYVVSGSSLYSVSSTGVATQLGIGISGTNIVSMSDNGTQLCIVNGVNGYIYSTATGFIRIVDPAFNPADVVTFFDEYFVFNWTGTNKFFISNILDGTTYDALAFASAEVQPDYVLSIVNQQENLLIFGTRSIETWYDSGDVNFPFARYDGATIERGLGAALATVKEDNSVFFLGNDLIFYRLNGVVPVRVSTHAIEAAWRQYGTTSDAYCFSITYEGHKWVVITFPSANATWVFDIATELWHERMSFNTDGSEMGRWRGAQFVYCYGKNLIGDAYTNTIGYFNSSTYTEYGNPIIGELVAPVIHADRHRVFMSRFELDVQTGIGLTTGQGSDPQIMVNWSDDGGRTYSQLQQWNTMGKIGEYLIRLRWLRLGQFRQRVMKVTISDPVPRCIIANSVDIEAGLA